VSVSAVVESVFNTILEQLSEEVGALLGAPIKFTGHQLQLISKEKLLAISRERSVLSTMAVTGTNNGDAYIITDLKDSVILGGTLIMLPPDQITENCKLRQFDGEAADAFGEIANIIAGVYTSAFLDNHPDQYHFKRTSVEDLVPAQVDPKSEVPFPVTDYIYSCCKIEMEGYDLHNLEVIVPAAVLGEAPQPEDVQDETANVEENNSAESEPAEQNSDNNTTEPDTEPPQTDVLIKKETVDRVLNAALQQCVEEMDAMLGCKLTIDSIATRYTSKKEFFAKPGNKTIATEMIINGDTDGIAYFLTDLKDAIFFAGTLIMLPADEIEKHITSGDFGEEEADAFGEVTNIVSGGLVQNFDEMYPRKFHLKKGEQEVFTPGKVVVEDPVPFPPGEYYVVTGTLSCATRELSEISFLCPVDVLHMIPRPTETGWGAPATSPDDEPDETSAAKESSSSTTPAEETAKSNVIVIICDNETLCDHFTESLQTTKEESIALSSTDSFNELRKKTVLGAFFVMTAVDEQSFATMIKIRAEIPKDSPLIVAGPAWTRSDVLKAVRYGATDILLTPASSAEICEKTKTNLKITCH
jgi:chemotaxis protein CheY-P-specific phosphatase CheC